MKNLLSFKTFCAILMISFISFAMVSCKKDEADDPVVNTDDCANFDIIKGSLIKFNGVDQNLSIATLQAFSDTYTFQLAGASKDCLELNTVSITINLSSGQKLGGTYPIKSFFDADENESSGIFTKQKISPVSVSQEELVSGTVKIVNNGVNDFNIDLTGKTIGGEEIKVSVRHKF